MSRVRAALWGVCAFAAIYLLVGAVRLPTLTYDPIARTVRLTADVGGISMRYYGQLAWDTVGGASEPMWKAVAALVVWAVILFALAIRAYRLDQTRKFS